MENTHLPLFLFCPACSGECGFNIRLLEYLEQQAIDMDLADLTDIDALVKEAIEGKHEHNAHFNGMPTVMPFALNLERQSLMIMVWCPKCDKPMYCNLTAQDLTELLKGDEDETPDTSST